MRPFLIGAANIAALACSSAATAQAPSTLDQDATAFGTRENVQSMKISPSGTKVVMLMSGPNSLTVVQLVDLATGQMTNLTSSNGRPEYLRWCDFAGETKLVCEHTSVEPIDGSMTGFSRLFTIGVDGQGMKPLGQQGTSRDRFLRQSDGDVIDWVSADEGKILFQRVYIPEVGTTGTLISRQKSGLGVDRIDLATLKSTQVEPPKEGVESYLTDGRGTVRIEMITERLSDSSSMTGRHLLRYRAAGSRDWRELGVYDSRDGSGLYPLAVDADTDSVFVLKKLNGRDALYRVKLDESRAETLIASDKNVDIDGVVRLGNGQRIVGYTYADERRRTVYFDPQLMSLQQSLAKALSGQPQISFHGASADGQKILVLASGDTNPGTFYRFDRTSKKLEEIGPIRLALAKRPLASVKPISFAASDGVNVPAYLTLPPGSAGKNLPAVVLPHGGPSARDEWGFDWLPQFLAARGYAVIQPNYRGSAGYGEEWLAENGFKGWRTSIGDVTAAARYLVSQGIADPNRLAIVGWSYGGYAALQSAAVEPSLYKAAVAIAPVTDLGMLRQQFDSFTNARLARDFIGNGPHLTEGSPLKNAAAIHAPVLIVHGNQDANVSIAQSERMVDALKGQGKKVEFLRLAGLDHQLDDSAARIELLTRIGTLLDQTIGH